MNSTGDISSSLWSLIKKKPERREHACLLCVIYSIISSQLFVSLCCDLLSPASPFYLFPFTRRVRESWLIACNLWLWFMSDDEFSLPPLSAPYITFPTLLVILIICQIGMGVHERPKESQKYHHSMFICLLDGFNDESNSNVPYSSMSKCIRLRLRSTMLFLYIKFRSKQQKHRKKVTTMTIIMKILLRPVKLQVS